MRWIAFASSLVVSLTASWASADAVAPALKTCPRGALPATDHGGPHCRPSTCETPEDCPRQSDTYPRPEAREFTCKAGLKLCVKNITAEGGWGTFDRDTAFGSCERDDDCEDGAKCLAAKRCVLGEEPEPPPASLPSSRSGKGAPSPSVEVRDTDKKVPTTSSGCASCSVSQQGGPDLSPLFALLGLLGIRRRS